MVKLTYKRILNIAFERLKILFLWSKLNETVSNTFKLPEIILNNLKNESNTDENIFCVYNYVQEHINNDDDLEQLYLAIIEFKPNAHFVGQYAWELFKKNRTAVAVSLMKNIINLWRNDDDTAVIAENAI